MKIKTFIVIIIFIMSFFTLSSCDISSNDGTKAAIVDSNNNDSNEISLTNNSNTVITESNETNYYDLIILQDNFKGNAGSVSVNPFYHKALAEGEMVTIIATTNQGYTFDGWYDEDDFLSSLESYTFAMPPRNLSYTAKWRANTNTKYKVEHYLQNIDDDNYTLYEIDNLTGESNSLINEKKAKNYEGFSLHRPINKVFIDGNGSTVLKLYYDRNLYTVALDRSSNNGGSVTGAGTYKYGGKAKISTTINPGSSFIGWYKDNELYTKDTSFDFIVGSTNSIFEAKYIVDKYTITIHNQVNGMSLTGIIDGCEYNYNSSLSTSLFESNSPISLIAKNIPSGHTIKWERSDGKKWYGDSYEFNMPADNLNISISAMPYVRDNNKIYFGTYPQTLITDDTLINELNILSGSKPNSTNSYDWIDYKYYNSSKYSFGVERFMFYQDIDYDKDGTYDYRGVYFTKYRKDSLYPTDYDASLQDDNGYLINTIYWFEFNPIEWIVLSEEEEKVLILANLLLDAQYYDPSKSDKPFEHNDGTGYSNNYELSYIRKWLNEDFYSVAFNDLQKNLIETTIVDNSVSSMIDISSGHYDLTLYNLFACNNTNDKLFLLSYMESGKVKSINLYEPNGTDYAKCQGLFELNYWFFRTPMTGSNYGYGAGVVEVQRSGMIGSVGCYSLRGIRPACWILL